ncbi:LysE family translocator [Poseidonibacter lekithochrous]|uniref:LysE family translocator n=1 Tax=Poseidonibacter lekithochrous TaxID=1904463 RepID=UPI0008FC29F7|nr:LysE family translocator [Poseidonibacter lekithochrous]QKJ22350.1 transporter, LysE family [Poseidonibacter lekithochrous]
MLSIEFIIAAIVVALIPGSGVIYTLSIAINSNRKNMYYAVLGCTLGIIPHIITSLLVLYFLININMELFTFIKYLGVAYLFYLSYLLYKSDGIFVFDEIKKSKNKIFLHGITINLLNPKLMIFLISFIPHYISSNNQIKGFIYLCGIFMLVSFVVFILYGLLATYIKKRLLDTKEKKNRVQKILSILFFLICIQILMNF